MCFHWVDHLHLRLTLLNPVSPDMQMLYVMVKSQAVNSNGQARVDG